MNRSLRRQLTAWITIATVTIGLTATACSFYLALEEGREVQDEQLRQTAQLVDSLGAAVTVWTELNEQILEDDPEARIFIAPVYENGAGASIQKEHFPPLPIQISEGFQAVKMAGESWRLYVHTLQSGQKIAAGQQTALRDEIAIDSALSTLLPILVLIPLLVVLTRAIIRKALAPVTQLSGQLDQRNDSHLHPLTANADLPEEIMPFVTSINSLMQRVDAAMAQQRRFIADAAHELRSPLTALTLQAENLEKADSPEERSERLQKLKHGLVRARGLLEQLLSLARQQAAADSVAEVRLDQLLRQTLEELMPMAVAKKVDLGCQRLEKIVVSAPALTLSILLRNAVDNALRYSPAGGRVDLELYLEGGDVVFQVADNGPGVPPGEEERLFEPFYRVMGSDETGSGLGLTIARTVADRLGGTATLRNREDGRGALFRFTFRQTL